MWSRALGLAPLVVLSRGLGLLTSVLVARWIGLGPAADAWAWALAIPTVLNIVGGNALATLLVPHFAAHPGHPGRVLARVVPVALGLGGLLAALAQGLLQVTRFDETTRAWATVFPWWLVPFVGLDAGAAVLRAALDARGKVQRTTAGTGVRAAVQVLVTGATLPTLGPVALPVGLLAGELGLVTLWSSAVAWSGPATAVPAALGRPLMAVGLGEGLVALQIVADKAVAATLDAGAVAALEAADRLRVILPSLFEATVVTSAWVSWSQGWARGERQAVLASARQTLGRVALWVPVVLVFALAYGEPWLRAALAGPAWDTAGQTRVWGVLSVLLVGVWPSTVATLAVRRLLLMGRHARVFALGALAFALNLGLDLWWAPTHGLVGVAWATVLTSTLACLGALAAAR